MPSSARAPSARGWAAEFVGGGQIAGVPVVADPAALGPAEEGDAPVAGGDQVPGRGQRAGVAVDVDPGVLDAGLPPGPAEATNGTSRSASQAVRGSSRCVPNSTNASTAPRRTRSSNMAISSSSPSAANRITSYPRSRAAEQSACRNRSSMAPYRARSERHGPAAEQPRGLQRAGCARPGWAGSRAPRPRAAPGPACPAAAAPARSARSIRSGRTPARVARPTRPSAGADDCSGCDMAFPPFAELNVQSHLRWSVSYERSNG